GAPHGGGAGGRDRALGPRRRGGCRGPPGTPAPLLRHHLRRPRRAPHRDRAAAPRARPRPARAMSVPAPVRAWVRLLLRTFPRAFRERFAPDMEMTFADRWRDAERPGGGRTLGLLARTTLDLLAAALRERTSPSHPRRPSSGGRHRMDALAHDLRFALR